MSDLRIDTFTDRREAVAIFEWLRGHDASKGWPLLPILTFVAEGGSGKSTLIEHLRASLCGKSPIDTALPYAHLDFTRSDAPKDMLSILVNIRNQLQEHKDGQGKQLGFPRFDLAAAIALETPLDGNLPLMGQQEIHTKLSAGLTILAPLGEMGHALNNLLPFISPILVGLRISTELPALQSLLRHIENGPGWKWYETNCVRMGLLAGASCQDVLLRLHSMSIPGKPGQQGREYLIENILPAAFFADLLDALVYSNPPHAWSKSAAVVIFLDGFEDLLSLPGASNLALRLLEILALSEHRTRGESDPLLLVVGSREYLLPELSTSEQQSSSNQDDNAHIESNLSDEARARQAVERWREQLPQDMSNLNLSDLYLPLWLHEFSEYDTRSYLEKLDKREHTSLFADDSMVQAIRHVAGGHPLALALAAAVVVEAKKRGRDVSPSVFLQAPVPRSVVPGHEHERIEQYLLDRFLRELSHAERHDMIACAFPRFLNRELLRTILRTARPTVSDIEVGESWEHYRHLTFMSALDGQRLVFHPIVRELLLRQLPPDADPESDYYRLHTRLRKHFQQRAARKNAATINQEPSWQAQLEEAYHALALGDPQPAIAPGISAQQTNLAAWQPLLETILQAPTELMPDDTEQQAYDALVQAEQQHYLEACVTAIVLYTWLLHARSRDDDRYKIASIQNSLGIAYQNLPGGDRAHNLHTAIDYYEAALQVRTRAAFPSHWAMTQNNLGLAYSNLPDGDRAHNLRTAVACYEDALQVFSSMHIDYYAQVVSRNLERARNELRDLEE
jgi:hypothetical protein